MASIVKIKRSSVQGKAPQVADLQSGELALNTRDGKLFSSDGSSVFEVGANTSTLNVGTLTVGNTTPFTLPTSDGGQSQILQTDGSGSVSWVDLTAAEGGGYNNSTRTSFPGYDLATGGSGTESFIGELGVGGVDAFGVSIETVFDNMDPIGRLETEDLGDSEAYVGA